MAGLIVKELNSDNAPPPIPFDAGSILAELDRLQKAAERKDLPEDSQVHREKKEQVLLAQRKRKALWDASLQKVKEQLLLEVEALKNDLSVEADSLAAQVSALRQQFETVAREKNSITVRVTALQHRAGIMQKRLGMS